MVDIASGVGTILNVLLYILLGGIVIITIYIFFNLAKYKHRVTIKDRANGNNIVLQDKFKISVDRNGITWWTLLKSKKKLAPAPSECIDITSKGKIFVHYIRYDNDNYIPVRDIVKDWNEEEEKLFVKSMQPYKQSQRTLMVNQHIKSERDRKLSIGEMLMKAAPYLTVILILVIFMIFFNDTVQPSIDMAEKLDARMKADQELDHRMLTVMERALEIIDGKQTLQGEALNNTGFTEVPN